MRDNREFQAGDDDGRGGSSSSGEHRNVVLPFRSHATACTRVEIADAEGRRIVECVPIPETGSEPDCLDPGWAMSQDGRDYQCRWTEGTGLEGPLVVRFNDGDNLLEVVHTTIAVPKPRIFTYEPCDTNECDSDNPERTVRYLIRDEDGRLEGLQLDTYREGLLVQRSTSSLHLGWSETDYPEGVRGRTTGWPAKLPFACELTCVTRVTLQDSAGRVLVECRPVSEAEVIEYLHREANGPALAFVAAARDGRWYQGERHDDLPFEEDLTVRMYVGERLVSVEPVVVKRWGS